MTTLGLLKPPAAMNRARFQSEERSQPRQRALQVALGVLWLIDAGLQFQPFMFTRHFATTVIAPNALDQPALIAWPIDTAAHFFAAAPVIFNTLFATVQLCIGVGLLRAKTARRALIASVLWAAGVWLVGEGLGNIFAGTASPLTGAPGAALLYVMAALVAWPCSTASTSARAEREGVLAWAVIWLAAAVLWLLPANQSTSSISSSLRSNASGEPSWLATLLRSAAAVSRGHGTSVAFALAGLSAAIALGTTWMPSRRAALVAGAALSASYWVFGQAFGQVLTGMATDVNAGPLFVLLAVALYPPGRRREAPGDRTSLPAAVQTSGCCSDIE